MTPNHQAAVPPSAPIPVPSFGQRRRRETIDIAIPPFPPPEPQTRLPLADTLTIDTGQDQLIARCLLESEIARVYPDFSAEDLVPNGLDEVTFPVFGGRWFTGTDRQWQRQFPGCRIEHGEDGRRVLHRR